jgi:hypothetical protein
LRQHRYNYRNNSPRTTFYTLLYAYIQESDKICLVARHNRCGHDVTTRIHCGDRHSAFLRRHSVSMVSRYSESVPSVTAENGSILLCVETSALLTGTFQWYKTFILFRPGTANFQGNDHVLNGKTEDLLWIVERQVGQDRFFPCLLYPTCIKRVPFLAYRSSGVFLHQEIDCHPRAAGRIDPYRSPLWRAKSFQWSTRVVHSLLSFRHGLLLCLYAEQHS